jgi:hypothetical protein
LNFIQQQSYGSYFDYSFSRTESQFIVSAKPPVVDKPGENSLNNSSFVYRPKTLFLKVVDHHLYGIAEDLLYCFYYPSPVSTLFANMIFAENYSKLTAREGNTREVYATGNRPLPNRIIHSI